MTTVESVKKLIQSEDFGERIRGINQLRDLELKQAFPLIKPLIKDDNVRVRYAAVSQLDTIGETNLEETKELLLDRLYNDSEADVKAAAADAIAGLKLTSAFPDLEKLYNETSDWLIQFSIVAALGELGDSRGFAILENALKSDNALVKTSAISALGELGNQKAIDLLLPFIDDNDWQIRHRLAQALGRLGGEKVKQSLEKLAQDTFAPVAEEAKIYLTQETRH